MMNTIRQRNLIRVKKLFTMIAIFFGQSLFCMEQVLEKTASDYALHEAAKSGNIEVLRQLIEQGNNIEDRNEAGETALHYVAVANKFESVKLLYELRANLEALDLRGNAPLLQARTKEMEDYLKKLGAKTNFFVTQAMLEKGKSELSITRSSS